MNAAVSLSPQLFVTDGMTGALQVKGESSDGFMGMLAQMMTNEAAPTPQIAALSGGDADDTTSKLMYEIYTMLLNGASTEDIAEKLSGLTDDQKLSLIETADEILTFISQPAMSDKDKVDSIIALLNKKKENTDIGLIYQVLSMMGINADAVRNENSADSQSNVTVLIANGVDQGITHSIIPTVNAPQTETVDFSKISEMLTKLVDAAKQSQTLPSDVKVVSSNIPEDPKQLELVRPAHIQYNSGAESEIKSAKESSEFDDLVAFAQQSKDIQYITPETVLAQKTEIPVQNQIANEIINQLNAGITSDTKELTLTLKPQELGDISIKLIKNGGEISVSIAAQNSATEKLLAERLPTLVSNLQEINSQVKDVMIVNPNENASSFLGQFNLSHSDSGTQYQQRQTTSNTYSGNSQSIAEEKSQQNKEFVREGQLWQMA